MENESVTAVSRPPVVLADLFASALLLDAVVVLCAAGFIGVLAQISVPLPGTPVPITGQTLGVLVAGCALGTRRAVASLLIYIGAGFAGLPWFISHSSGWQGPSTGYLFGFLLASGVCGYLAGRGADRTVLRSLSTMVVGEICIYLVGVTWLALDLHVGARRALDLGFNPFVPGDAIKLVLAASLLPGAWYLAGRSGRLKPRA